MDEHPGDRGPVTAAPDPSNTDVEHLTVDVDPDDDVFDRVVALNVDRPAPLPRGEH